MFNVFVYLIYAQIKWKVQTMLHKYMKHQQRNYKLWHVCYKFIVFVYLVEIVDNVILYDIEIY